MNYAIVSILFVGIILNFAIQLTDIANETSQMTLSFASSMNNDLECVLDGGRLTECQQDVQRHSQKDFIKKLNQTQELVNEFETDVAQLMS